jgi:serine/threonine protein kinase
MAPEQIRATRSLDARADIYALGAILYECLAGQPAFAAATAPALMYKILEERPTPLADLRPELPRELVAIVERALAYDREARFPSARELERALDPFRHRSSQCTLPASDDTTDAGEDPPAAPQPALGPSRREPRPPWSVALTLAVVAGGLGLAAGSLMQPALEDRVTTSRLPAVPTVAAPPTNQIPQASQLSAELSLRVVEPVEPPLPGVTQHHPMHRRSESRAAHPAALLTVGEGRKQEEARPRPEVTPPEEPPAALGALSSSVGASAPRVDLERANPYRQKQ